MRRALVTGASGGIGSVIAKQLAADGYAVLVHAMNNPDKAEAVVDSIRAEGGTAETVVFDVTDAEASRACLELALQDGVIEVIVNNAGVHDDGLMAAMSESQWHQVIDVSLHGFYHVTQPLLMPLLRHRRGRIISISSVSGVVGNAGQVNYSAAKAGLHGATKALAREVAARGITVNAVAPGIIETPMVEGVFTAAQIRDMVPMRRAGQPEDVANLVSFLASDRAGYISGQVISVNGAMV